MKRAPIPTMASCVMVRVCYMISATIVEEVGILTILLAMLKIRSSQLSMRRSVCLMWCDEGSFPSVRVSVSHGLMSYV